MGSPVAHPDAAGERKMALIQAAQGIPLLRWGAWLEHGVAAHPLSRRQRSSHDHARLLLEIPRDVLNGEFIRH